MATNLITFYGNRVARDLVIVRASDLANGTRPQDVVGDGYFVINAPDSEVARSMLAVKRQFGRRS